MYSFKLPLFFVLLLLLAAAPAAAIDGNSDIPRYVVGDILGNATVPDTGMVVANVSTQTGIIYVTYDVVKNGSRWEIQKYWHGDFQLTEAGIDTSGIHRIDHADPIIVIITDPTITGGDMQYTGLSLAEAMAGVLYPVEPAPGEPGSGTPLYVVGDILGNASMPTKGAVVASVRTGSGEPTSYGTFEVMKNGNRWEIEKYYNGGFSYPENVLISSGIRRIDHADPHTVVVVDSTITGGDMQYTGLSLAEIHARGGGYGVDLWQDRPGPGTPSRYLAGDILGNDTASIRYVVGAVADPINPDAFPIYTTYEVVKNGTRWEIQKYWNGNLQVDALQVFNLNLHRIDHVDPHTVIVVDQTITSGGQSYFRLSLGEILGGTPPVPQEQIVLVLPSGNSPRDINHDGLYEDLNGNDHLDFNDVVLFFNNMDWIADNEPVSAFDFNRNGRIDFNDIVVLFNEL